MKKQIFSLAVALLISSAACMAQDHRRERPDHTQRIEKMISELGLDKKQAEEFKKVMEEMKPSKDNSGKRPSREEMEAKRQEMNEKIQNILTEEQYKKYQSMSPQGRQKKAK